MQSCTFPFSAPLILPLMAQDDAPTMRENGVPLTLGFGDIKTETNNLKDNYTDIAEVIAIHNYIHTITYIQLHSYIHSYIHTYNDIHTYIQ